MQSIKSISFGLKMALEKKRAREEFKRMMEEEESKKKGKDTQHVPDAPTSGRSTDGLNSNKSVGVDDVDAGFGNTVSVEVNLTDVVCSLVVMFCTISLFL